MARHLAGLLSWSAVSEDSANVTKMTTCLWLDHGKAREAAEFYASVFPDSQVGAAHASAADNPSAQEGEDGGEESQCGWCKDRWGFSWQITPRVLLETTTDPDRAAAKRAMEAMMTMKKIDIATIEVARRAQS